MSAPGEPEVTGRLQRALETFQNANALLLTAHRKLKGLPPEEVDRFWMASGTRLEAHVNAAATEVLAAFKAFSATGLVASGHDRRLVNDAQRHITGGGR